MSISVNIKAPQRMIDDVKSFYKSTKWMGNITKDIKKRVVKNTASGKDFKSRKFKPYSIAYAKKKGSGVDLRDTGVMMDAVTAKVINALTGVVFIKGASGLSGANRTVIAAFHNFGMGRNPVREFMNIPKSVTKQLVKEFIDDPVQKIINRHR